MYVSELNLLEGINMYIDASIKYTQNSKRANPYL